MRTLQHPEALDRAAPAPPSGSEAVDSPENDADDEAVAAAWGLAFRRMPAWLVSLVVHLVLLLSLALCKFAEDKPSRGVFVLAETVEAPDELVENLAEFELNVRPLEFTSVAGDSPLADVGVTALGDVTLAAELDARDVLSDVSLSETAVDEIGALFGKDGAGMADIGDGLKAVASFFGARSRGEKFVFIVDNSNSMIRGRFETALLELVRTVDNMSPQQQFYVIFFSDSAYRMFHPDPAPGLVPATERNKQRLKYWLSTVPLCLHTRGREAVTAALAMNPDVIYILGDGVFTDDSTELLTAPHERRIPIHTLGMEVELRGEQQLRAIADANHGTYRAVSASPQAQQMAQANPIPRNRTRGPVWGLNLPLVDMGKKKKR